MRRKSKQMHKNRLIIGAGLVIAIMFIALIINKTYLLDKQLSRSSLNNGGSVEHNGTKINNATRIDNITEQVYPSKGFILPVKWNGAVKRLVDAKALNLSFIASSLNNSGKPLTKDELMILNGSSNSNVTLNANTGTFTLYLLWALGINNKNEIINNGSVAKNGNPYEFASTGGYGPLGKLSLGNLSIITLNYSQQKDVEAISSSAYRPCCDNPASFPDCNHGAAQLGLVELMISQGQNRTQVYKALKDFNSFYYPQQYFEVALFFNVTQQKAWNQVPADEVLGYNFSSYSGASKVHQYLLTSNTLAKIGRSSGGGCGV